MPAPIGPHGLPPGPRWLALPPPRALHGSPGPRPRLRDLGHLRPLLREGLLDSCLRWARENNGEDFLIWAGPVPHLIIAQPSSVLRVLADDDEFVRNVAPTGRLFGEGLLRLEGEPWARRRRALKPAFRGEALESFVPIVQEESERLEAAWAIRSAPFRPARELSFTMLRVLGRALFGFSFHPERHGGSNLHRALVTLSSDTVLRLLLSRPVAWALQGRAVARSLRWLNGLCAEILDTGGDTPFLAALRDGITRGELPRATAIDEVRTFLVAGHETSVTALSWGLTLLAEHPERADELGPEGEAARSATRREEVTGLSATTRFVKEALRLYPPVPVSVSQAGRDTQLGRWSLPRGTRVDLSSYVLHRLPQHWPEPDRFDPDRFRVAPAPGTWLPFLLGPHTCLGIQLAMIELPLVLARLATRFHFTLPQGPPRVNLRLSLHPAGLEVRVEERARAAQGTVRNTGIPGPAAATPAPPMVGSPVRSAGE